MKAQIAVNAEKKQSLRNFATLNFFIIWVSLTLAGISWALATPLGASPDEPAHIIKAAAVAHGEILGQPTDKPAVTIVQVPLSLAYASSWPCYATHENFSAGCIPDTPDGKELTAAETSAGLYNPMYYALVGWPSTLTEDGATAVYLMRIISVILVSFFLTICWTALKSLTGSVISGLIFFAVATPMVFFLSGAVNPNALEISSGTAFVASLLLLLRNSTKFPKRTMWLIAMAVSGLVLANTRGISPFWLLLMFGLAAASIPFQQLLVQLKDSRFISAIVIVFAGVIASAMWVLSSGTLTAMGSFPGAGQVSPLRAFMTMVLQKTADPGLIGVFGWLDTFAPPVVYAIWSILIGGIVSIALILARRRSRYSMGCHRLLYRGASTATGHLSRKIWLHLAGSILFGGNGRFTDCCRNRNCRFDP